MTRRERIAGDDRHAAPLRLKSELSARPDVGERKPDVMAVRMRRKRMTCQHSHARAPDGPEASATMASMIFPAVPSRIHRTVICSHQGRRHLRHGPYDGGHTPLPHPGPARQEATRAILGRCISAKLAVRYVRSGIKVASGARPGTRKICGSSSMSVRLCSRMTSATRWRRSEDMVAVVGLCCVGVR